VRKLYPHQEQALAYARQRENPLLFMEMRLGKTAVVLRRCKEYIPRGGKGFTAVLVVAPNSAVGSWERECELEGVDFVNCASGTRDQRRQKALDTVEALIGSKRKVKHLAVLLNREGWRVVPDVADEAYQWDAVILDEAHFIKNPRAEVTKFFLRSFQFVPHKWVLTGTPCGEGEEDAITLLNWSGERPGGTSNYWQFRQRFMEPHPMGYGWALRPDGKEVLRQAIGKAACVMRRKDVRMERQKVHERREVEMPEAILKHYQELEKAFATKIGDAAISTIHAGAQWQALRQLADGWLDGQCIWARSTGKVAVLLDLLCGELLQEQVVVWCSYNQEVTAIHAECAHLGIPSAFITGDIHPDHREKLRQRFQAGKLRVLILQQACAQTGLDLSASDTAVYFSTPAGLVARQQTEDRILSLAKKSPLLYIDLCTKNTVDEDLVELIRDKAIKSDRALSRALSVAIQRRNAL
jgi:SNF2 family DNA or RNA helicase